MPKSLYLINPRSDFPTYFGAEAFAHWGARPAAGIADLAVVTVAALVPSDWDIKICDEFVEPVDFDSQADFIGITGKVTQAGRMLAIAAEFQRRGKTVIIGGPHASLDPATFRGSCDILVVGELEGIATEFFSDLEQSTWKEEYTAEKPDLALSPLPRWELYPNDRALIGCVQTSRGCPFECEFCDVIQYLGRNQRHKSVKQILAELDQMYELGYRSVFLADDNFTVYRKRAKEVLAALRDWNAERDDPIAFGTQLSIDAARDPEIMRGLGEAGIVWVFIGIETPNAESLKESKKRQNVGIDLQEQIQVFLDHGIAVWGGMMVGFDHDGLDIFEQQLEFAMASPIALFSLHSLVAPVATPLFDRMEQAGRLIEADKEMWASPWTTNIIPAMMTREQLLTGVKWLSNQLYSPENFGTRLIQSIERLGPQIGPFRKDRLSGAPSTRPVEAEALNLMKKFIRSGPEERKMWKRVCAALAKKPDTRVGVMMELFRYAQARCLYDRGQVWDPHPTQRPVLPAGVPLVTTPALQVSSPTEPA